MIDFKDIGFTRVAAVSSEMKVADVEFNKNKVLSAIEQLEKQNIHIINFQELTLSSYTSADLFFNSTLLENCQKAIIEIKEFSKKFNTIAIIGSPLKIKNKLFNTAFVIAKGKIHGIIIKSFLPNYSEFYEKRWFSEASKCDANSIQFDGEIVPIGNDLIFNNKYFSFGIEICEDLWAVNPISNKLAINGAEIIFNLSAGNELVGKSKYRKDLVSSQSARTISAYIYSGANPSESSTDVTYSGHLLIAENGNILKESRNFNFDTEYIISDIDLDKIRSERLRNKTFSDEKNSEIRFIDIDADLLEINELIYNINKRPFVPFDNIVKKEVCEEILNIQSTALAKRLKHIGISKVTIGISGGLDSTLALIVCKKAFDKLGLDSKGIHSIVMPGPGSSSNTQENAEKLANLLGTTFIEIDINKAVELHLKDIDHLDHNFDITYENSQARERTQILMDYANKIGGITVGTGDLSELALGWCTYNADQVSMYGVNAGVPKTLVRYLIQYYSESCENPELQNILEIIIDQPISPELIPADKSGNISQFTEDKIGPYILNDFFLFYFLRYAYTTKKIFELAKIAFKDDYSVKEILKWLEKFVIRFISSQFKRSMMPDGIKVGSIALSPRADLRMPSDASANIWLKEIQEIKDSLNG